MVIQIGMTVVMGDRVRIRRTPKILVRVREMRHVMGSVGVGVGVGIGGHAK
jgi:hypothetical protein